jgi:hypothetical protein
MSKKQTQCARVLELLSSGREISALELSSISLQYAARVCELRKSGATIANRVEVKADGTRHGFYRLVLRAPFPGMSQTCARTVPKVAEAEHAERVNDSLFTLSTFQYPD